MEKIFLEDSRKKTNNSVCYDIHLRPAVILHNSLPLPLRALASGTNDDIEVSPGGSSSLSFVDPAGSSSIVLKVYILPSSFFLLFFHVQFLNVSSYSAQLLLFFIYSSPTGTVIGLAKERSGIPLRRQQMFGFSNLIM